MQATACSAPSKMPHKPVFFRPPLLNISHCFPAAGTFRASDERIIQLYRKAERYIDYPCMWEGLFRIACLLKNKPAEEAVAARIIQGIEGTDNGAFTGSLSEQISIARAAFALFEYNTDRSILKRISEWLRYVEIEFDTISIQDDTLFCPADLMELLVRFYQSSGIKSALRLCARLRAEAFDWTTSLHTFQQSIPIHTDDKSPARISLSGRPRDMDYSDKQRLINHAELLADGVRYSLFAGLFSGHAQDLSAGKSVWDHLVRYHHALCGGTTGNPYLSGNGSDQPVCNTALSAWTEAFSAQLITRDSFWAADELIRIIFNGLDDCLNSTEPADIQQINCLNHDAEVKDPVRLYARLSRAVSAAYSHSISLTETGFRINYLLPGRMILMIGKQPVVIYMDTGTVRFQCKNAFTASVEMYLSSINSCSVSLIRAGSQADENSNKKQTSPGSCIRIDREWNDQDIICFIPENNVLSMDTHHHGIAFFASNRLLCMKADMDNYATAVFADAAFDCGHFSVSAAKTDKWHIKGGQPSDIPVLPETKGDARKIELTEYSSEAGRISMFPRAR